MSRVAALCLFAAACTAAPPKNDRGELVIMPVTANVSQAASGSSTSPAPPSPVPGVKLAHRHEDPPGQCSCASVFATANLDSERLKWTGTRPSLPPSSLLVVADLARMQCAIPYGAGVPSFERATADGPNIEVHLSWRFEGEPVQSAAFIPAPGPGGRVFALLHGSWMRPGDTEKVESCEASRGPSR